ncbi:MAG: serine/threonine protein kinase [Myxococcales bacterium]|nr:serine/threonine protein kinase [Myxococcales bacterium]
MSNTATHSVDCLDANEIVDLFEGRHGEATRVQEHLDACDACRMLLTELTHCERSASEEVALRHAESPQTLAVPGTMIARYRVERVVGYGGMGVVYAAHDPKLDRMVALKLLRPSEEDPAARESLLARESKVMAKLASAHVATIYDVGDWQGCIYVALEYASGGTLKEWCKEPRSWQHTLDLFVAAGKGLKAAHEVGVVHGDFTPSNVLLTAQGEVRVSDFGLARVAGEALPPLGSTGAGGEETQQTRSLVGTPAFMAPEQFAGEPATETSDQYSFCVALFEALHGYRPFEAETIAQLAEATLHGSMRQAPADSSAPPWLSRALARGLSRDPQERYPSMGALLHDLTSPRRRWLPLALALLLALGLTLLLVVDSRSATELEPIPEFEAMEAAAEKSLRDARLGQAVGEARGLVDFARQIERQDLEVRALLILSRSLVANGSEGAEEAAMQAARLSQRVSDPGLRSEALARLANWKDEEATSDLFLELAGGASNGDGEGSEYLELVRTTKQSLKELAAGDAGYSEEMRRMQSAIAGYVDPVATADDPCAPMQGPQLKGLCYSVQATLDLEDVPGSVTMATRALEILEPAMGPEHCDLQLALIVRGSVLIESDAEKAEQDLSWALRLCPEEEEDRDPLELAWTQALVRLERFDEAAAAIETIDPSKLDEEDREGLEELKSSLAEQGAPD